MNMKIGHTVTMKDVEKLIKENKKLKFFLSRLVASGLEVMDGVKSENGEIVRFAVDAGDILMDLGFDEE